MRAGTHHNQPMQQGYLTQIFRKDDTAFVAQRLYDELVLVALDPRQQVKNLSLNAVASRIWELIDGQRPATVIRDTLIEEFEADSEVVTADLIFFLQQLEKFGVVKPV